MKDINVASYLEGEMNAVKACGKAIQEASDACRKKLKANDAEFVLLELLGIMLRASGLIKEKNESIGITESL